MSFDNDGVLDEREIIDPSVEFPLWFKITSIVTAHLMIFNMAADYQLFESGNLKFLRAIGFVLLYFSLLSLTLAPLVALIPYKKLPYSKKYLLGVVVVNFVFNAFLGASMLILLIGSMKNSLN